MKNRTFIVLMTAMTAVVLIMFVAFTIITYPTRHGNIRTERNNNTLITYDTKGTENISDDTIIAERMVNENDRS